MSIDITARQVQGYLASLDSPTEAAGFRSAISDSEIHELIARVGKPLDPAIRELRRTEGVASLFAERMNVATLAQLLDTYYAPTWQRLEPLLAEMGHSSDRYLEVANQVAGGYGRPLQVVRGIQQTGLYDMIPLPSAPPPPRSVTIIEQTVVLQGRLLPGGTPGAAMGHLFGHTERRITLPPLSTPHREVRVVSESAKQAVKVLIHGVEILRIAAVNSYNWYFVPSTASLRHSARGPLPAAFLSLTIGIFVLTNA